MRVYLVLLKHPRPHWIDGWVGMRLIEYAVEYSSGRLTPLISYLFPSREARNEAPESDHIDPSNTKTLSSGRRPYSSGYGYKYGWFAWEVDCIVSPFSSWNSR
jgi:hypothetical protein